MLKKAMLWSVAVCFILVGTSMAEERGTPEEAQAIVKKAIAYFKTNGKEKTFAEINNPKGMFRKKDLFIFVCSTNDGVILAHGAVSKLVGKNVHNMKSPDGRAVGDEMVSLAKSKGSGWIEYKWSDPLVTKKFQAKKTYVESVDDIFFACGAYRS